MDNPTEAIANLVNYVYDDEYADYRECASNGNSQKGHIFESVLAVKKWLDEPDPSLSEIHGGTWGEHDDYPVADWVMDATNGDTRLGYWEWVADMIEARED